MTNSDFFSSEDYVLANVPANTPAPQFIPYIGDYVHLMAVGPHFYGIFSANNTPDLSNFPNGVTYQRNADFAAHTLLNTDNETPVKISIDPFSFEIKQPRTEFGYAAKIVCGDQRNSKELRLTKGRYATTINIHNPNDTPVTLFKKLSLTFPPKEQEPGMIIPIDRDILRPNEALKVDCVELERLLPDGFPYIEGFVVIESDKSLNVTAVYTAANLEGFLSSSKVRSIDVEQIHERRKARIEQSLPDLVPVPGPDGFCIRKNGKLAVTVRNQGSAASGTSITEVDFFIYGAIPMSTPPLGPGESVELLFDITPNCFDVDCEFRITVDAMNDISESEEGNNTANDRCIG